MLEPSHVPVHMPPQVPENIAVQPASHEPVHDGAVQVPEHSPVQLTFTVAVHEPWHVPVHMALGAVTSHAPLQVPLHPTTTSPPMQFAAAEHFALAVQLASQVPSTVRSA
jgi:hypothetical protein